VCVLDLRDVYMVYCGMTSTEQQTPDYANVDFSALEAMGITVEFRGQATITPYHVRTKRTELGLMANKANPNLLFVIGNSSGKLRGYTWFRIIDNKLTPYS